MLLRGEKGFLLITTLMVMLILMILGMSLVAITSQDYQFAHKELLNLQAYYLAKAGLEYSQGSTLPSSEVTLLSKQKRYLFHIREEGPLVYSTGLILAGDGTVLATERLTSRKEEF